MKKNYKKLASLFLAAGLTIGATAQFGDMTKVLEGGQADANVLLKAYAEPMCKGFGLGFANGWYNIGSVHKTLGFDLTITGGVAMAPTSLQTYDISKLALTTLKTTGTTVGPTISGKDEKGPQVTYSQQVTRPDGVKETVSKSFNMPNGFGINFAPSAMIQAGVGLPFGNEIMVRFLPTISIGDFGKLGLWGIGIKHDIKQWLPVVKDVPFWSLSGMVGYTSFKTSVTGKFLVPSSNDYYLTGVDITKDYNNQGVELLAKALTMNLIVSTNIPIINAYGGLGITRASSELKLTGNYPLPAAPTTADVAGSVAANTAIKSGVKNMKDPIDIKYDAETLFRANIGVRLKLAVITIHADATFSGGYTLYTGGLGFSFR